LTLDRTDAWAEGLDRECRYSAVVLCTTMLVAYSLQSWSSERGLYRPLARSCVGTAVACRGMAAVDPAPLLLGLTLVVLFRALLVFAVGCRLHSRPATDVT
jgi:hypothetical protein